MSGLRMLRPVPIAALVLGWLASAVLAQTQWSPDPNVNNPVTVVSDVQSLPIVVGDGISGAYFAWRSARFDPGTGTTVYDLYAQHFNSSGVPLWAPNGVLVASGTVSGSGTPANPPFGMAPPAPFSIDGPILAWHDVRNAPDAGDIYAQQLNSTAGIPQWIVGGVPVTNAGGLQDSPALVSDGSGGAIITWQDRRNGNSDIYAQRLNASGLPQWFGQGVAVCAAPGDQLMPKIIQSGVADRFTLTWADSRAGNLDIYAQELSVAGGPQWMLDGVPVSAAPGNQTRPVIAPQWAIAWEDDRNGGDKDIYAQQMSFLGAPQWTSNGVQVANTPNASAPSIVRAGSGGSVIIAWQDERNGPANIDIFAQSLGGSGVPQWTANGITVSGAAGNQVSPVATSVDSGLNPHPAKVIVAWEDMRNGAADVFAQGIAITGVVQWTPNGVPISTAPNRQGRISSVQAPFEPAGAILVWEDDRNGATNTDIYAAKISATGVLPVLLQTFTIE